MPQMCMTATQFVLGAVPAQVLLIALAVLQTRNLYTDTVSAVMDFQVMIAALPYITSTVLLDDTEDVQVPQFMTVQTVFQMHIWIQIMIVFALTFIKEMIVVFT